MSRHTGNKRKGHPFVLKSFVTGSVKDLRNGDVFYVRSHVQVEAIENVLDVNEILKIEFPTPYGYRIRLEEKDET